MESINSYIREMFEELEQLASRHPDPVERLQRCDLIYQLAQELIVRTGANGVRGQAARDAVKNLGLEQAAEAAGYTVSTMRRVSGR